MENVELYNWLLNHYTQEGDKVLDTHLGSGTMAIACHYAGIDLVACEIDKDYFEDAKKFIKEQTAQLTIF